MRRCRALSFGRHMSADRLPRAPAGLSSRGQRFWRDTLAEFDLTDAELAILTEACRTLDDLDRLAGAVAAHGVMVKGSAGQDVINPALTEARGQRAVLHRLLAALALPDPDGKTVPTTTSLNARRAAQSRWRGHQKETG